MFSKGRPDQLSLIYIVKEFRKAHSASVVVMKNLRLSFNMLKNGRPIATMEYSGSSCDAGVLEDVNFLLTEKKYAALRIRNLIKILSETDPKERERIDKECMQAIEEAKRL